MNEKFARNPTMRMSLKFNVTKSLATKEGKITNIHKEAIIFLY
jgi:hypothetical protein